MVCWELSSEKNREEEDGRFHGKVLELFEERRFRRHKSGQPASAVAVLKWRKSGYG